MKLKLRARKLGIGSMLLAVVIVAPTQSIAENSYRWRYYRPGNTGIQGDINEALYVSPNGDPYIGGYDPGFEEGGFALFMQAQNRWLNYSNVDFPVFGHPDEQGCIRFSDIAPDRSGDLWLGSWRGVVRFSNRSSRQKMITRFGAGNSSIIDNNVTDIDMGPDGTMWFANGGTSSFNPKTNAWTRAEANGQFIAVQRKVGSGYWVYTSGRMPEISTTSVLDSATGQWTTIVPSGAPDEIVGLPGKDSVDEAGNLWALRSRQPGEYVNLHYRKSDGTWVTPEPPYESVTFGIEAFKAYGNGRALLVDNGGTTWQFDGTTWHDRGAWRVGDGTMAVDIDSVGNIWVSGSGGAAKRNVATGEWQRYRITNTANFDTFNRDITINASTGDVYASANAAAGIGGMTRFDGVRWTGWNQLTYGLGFAWPFPTDNCDAMAYRPSTGGIVTSPSWLHGIHEWTGAQFEEIPGLQGTKKIHEDAVGRIWALGEYYNLQFLNGSTWIPVDIIGWADMMHNDPVDPQQVWIATDQEIVRTDGANRFSRRIEDFAEASPSSDAFMGIAPDEHGVWVGAGTINLANGLLFYVNRETGDYVSWVKGVNWPFPGDYVRVLGRTPDGLIWMNYSSDYPSEENGLLAFDGTHVVKSFQAPFGGVPQWGGLPHASIADFEVKLISGSEYEIWMSCLSRGLAVLKVKQLPSP